jgi:hypothetical protein
VAFKHKVIHDLLTKLPLDKSAGTDDIPPRFLQAISNIISIPLCILFRKSLDNGLLSDDWRTANVTPIYKKGDRHIPGNYRPVSLTSQFSKLIESVIRDAITAHLDRFHLITSLSMDFVMGTLVCPIY